MDEISQLQKLAGINSFQGYTPYTIEDGSNISITGNEKAVIQREQDIRPGTEEWFKLWFSRPYWKQLDYPAGFRGRK